MATGRVMQSATRKTVSARILTGIEATVQYQLQMSIHCTVWLSPEYT